MSHPNAPLSVEGRRRSIKGSRPDRSHTSAAETGCAQADAALSADQRPLCVLLPVPGPHVALAVADRVRAPVPVLLSVEGWNPGRRQLSDPPAGRLAADHRLPRSNVYGRDAAVRSAQDRRIALFLGGFDEVALRSRTAVLRQTDQHADHRVVIFSRTEHYAETVRAAGSLNGAAVLELLPVSGKDAAAFLAHCQVDPAPDPWQRLIVHRGTEPAGQLADALDSPLAPTLVRDGFRQDPAGVRELLEPGRFATHEEIVDRLLGRLVDITYRDVSGETPSSGRPEPARRWLGHPAARLVERDSCARPGLAAPASMGASATPRRRLRCPRHVRRPPRRGARQPRGPLHGAWPQRSDLPRPLPRHTVRPRSRSRQRVPRLRCATRTAHAPASGRPRSGSRFLSRSGLGFGGDPDGLRLPAVVLGIAC